MRTSSAFIIVNAATIRSIFEVIPLVIKLSAMLLLS